MMRMTACLAALTFTALSGCSLTGSGSGDLYGDMSDSDVQMAANAMQAGLENRPDGDKESWVNAHTGREGAITPVATYVSDNGYFCRRYKEEMALAGGRFGVSLNRACRNDDGIWVWHQG